MVFFGLKLYDIDSYQCNIEEAMSKGLINDRSDMDRILALRSLPMYHPLHHTQIKFWRKHERRKHKIWLTMEFFMTGILFIMVSVIIMKMWTARHYYSNSHLLLMVSAGEQFVGCSFQDSIQSMRYMEYLTSKLLPALYMPNVTSSDNSSLPVIHWTSDNITQFLNVPQLRQLRVKQGYCSLPIKFDLLHLFCTSDLNENTEDKTNYTKQWSTLFRDTIISKSPWTYTDKIYSHSVPLFGRSGSVYHGGGYIAELGYTHKESSLTVSDLRESMWLDNATRVTFVEVVFYNVNTDVFTGISLVTEFLTAGSMLTVDKILSANVILMSGFSSILLLLIYLLYTFHTIIIVNKTGILIYISHIWNVFKLGLAIAGFSFVFLYLTYLYNISLQTEHFQKTKVFRFFSLFHFSNVFSNLIIILIVLITLIFLQCCKFGIKFIILYKALNLTKYVLWLILIILLIISKLHVWIYYLNNGVLDPRSRDTSLHKFLCDKSYDNSPHDSSFKMRLFFVSVYRFLFLLSVVALIYYYKQANHVYIKSSFNYCTFIYNEIYKRLVKAQTHNVTFKISGLTRSNKIYYTPSYSAVKVVKMVKSKQSV